MFRESFERITGVSTNTEKSKGLSRLWEIIMDNTAHFFISSLFCVLSFIPAGLGIFYSLSINNIIVLFISSIIGCAIFGLFYGTMINGMLIAMRDETGDWLKKYSHALKRDFKDNMIAGALVGLILFIGIYVLCLIKTGSTLPVSMIACTAVTILVALAIFTYLWPQRVFFDLKLLDIIRNSIFMSLAHPLVTLSAILVQIIYWSILILLVPYSIIFLVIFGLWFPALLSIFITYNKMNTEFHIEEKLGINNIDDKQ